MSAPPEPRPEDNPALGEPSAAGAEPTGTHPLSMVGAVAGLGSIFCGVMNCLDPRLGGIIHTALGLLAVGAGVTVWLKVRQGTLDQTNIFQARMALGVGGVGLTIGLALLAWWSSLPSGY